MDEVMKRIPHKSLLDFKRIADSDRLVTPGDEGVTMANYDGMIAWSRVDTPDKAIAWLLHLSHKTWFTREMCRDFIVVVSARFGWDMALPL